MNLPELTAALADKTGFTKTTADSVIRALGETVHEALRQGDEVTLPGLGKFSVSHMEARTGRNPQTGEAIEIAARNKPTFSAAKALKDAVN